MGSLIVLQYAWLVEMYIADKMLFYYTKPLMIHQRIFALWSLHSNRVTSEMMHRGEKTDRENRERLKPKSKRLPSRCCAAVLVFLSLPLVVWTAPSGAPTKMGVEQSKIVGKIFTSFSGKLWIWMTNVQQDIPVALWKHINGDKILCPNQ